MPSEARSKILKAIIVIATIYLFLLSIKLLGHSFKLLGKDFAEAMIEMTSNPFMGLVIGIVATSLIQSSSTTTSIVVGLVAGGALDLHNAIPIIMGANIGTTITNALVSMGHIFNRQEFKRAFSASIVHDFFNICTVIVFFPIEINFHIIAKIASVFEGIFAGAGGLKIFNPLNFILQSPMHLIDQLFAFVPYRHIAMMVFSIVLLMSSLIYMVKTIRSLILSKIELIINNFLFRNDALSLTFGMLMTAIVQSSSVTTSLVVPLAGAGLVSLRKIYPYTLGANIGTTVTAILAALATQNPIAITVAFSHLCFNILGILVFYPLKFIPIKLAEFVGETASKSKKNLVIFITLFLLSYFIPVILIFLY